MTENKKPKPRLTLLTGIASAIGAWVASSLIFAIIGYGTFAAFTLAPIIAVGVFAAFMVRLYNDLQKAPRPVAKPANQRCLMLAAPTHGVLQDRTNYWLLGGYGKVTGHSLAITDKGFYLAIFYYDATEITKEIKELPLREESNDDNLNDI